MHANFNNGEMWPLTCLRNFSHSQTGKVRWASLVAAIGMPFIRVCLSGKRFVAFVESLLGCGIKFAHLWIILADLMKDVLRQVVILRLP